MMEILILIIYGLALLFIFFYSMVQLHLVYLYLKNKNQKVEEALDATFLPSVTVQLPVYNEMYVVERLLDSVAEFDYPPALLQIQVLDDSTDETIHLIAARVAHWKSKGVNITQLRRPTRDGYKAGALQYGLEIAHGEYVAIFDADFMPRPDFLRQTMPHFKNPKVGVVQTKWEHVNENYSMLTRLQAFGLNAHFSVEQSGRNAGNFFINFNGTGGVWRKACITDAGGWQADTLTEDLDLSYRAQMRGWKFKYLEHVGSPAELPAEIKSLKSQQFRWTKGAAETARKNLASVLTSSFPVRTKVHALFHLLNSTVFLCIIIISLLSIPVLYIKSASPELELIFEYASLFLLSLLVLGLYYFVSTKQQEKGTWATIKHFTVRFPLFLAMSMGISLHNSLAVVQAYAGYKTPFIRTPKFNIRSAKDKWSGKQYQDGQLTLLNIAEGAMCLYFVFGIYSAFKLNDFGLLPFHILLSVGFGIVFYYSIVYAIGSKRNLA